MEINERNATEPPRTHTKPRDTKPREPTRGEVAWYGTTTNPKLCHWTKVRNHYQAAFVHALGAVCDLRTVYFESIVPERIALGWDDKSPLSGGEIKCETLGDALATIPDWRERIHIVPGYGGPFQRDLARHLSANGVPWADWSESSTPGWKWYARLPVKRWWTKMVAKYALGSFAIGSQAEDDFVRRGLNRSQISYLPYVTAPFEGEPTPDVAMQSFKQGRKAFLFLGTLNQRKGVDILLKAAMPVLKEHQDWALVLVGNDTPDSKYKNLADKLGLSSEVFFRGPVNPATIGNIVAAADVAVLPSRYDGWGVAINEALNGGLAIIASDKCGAGRDLVTPGQNGFRVKAGSQADLELALRRYTTSTQLSARQGEASRKAAIDVDPNVNAQRMLMSLSVWMNEWEMQGRGKPDTK